MIDGKIWIWAFTSSTERYGLPGLPLAQIPENVESILS